MINFNFVVDEADAENILACIREQANRCNEKILDYMAKGVAKDSEEIQLLVSEKSYFLSLLDKMKNTKV